MGLWQWIFGGRGPELAIDVTRFSDAKLRKTWAERRELTDEAREAVRVECLRRDLELRGLRKAAPPDVLRATTPGAAEDEPWPEARPLASGDIIDVKGPSIALQTTPGRWALVLLPSWDPAAKLPERPLDAIIVCNQEPRGWLATTALAQAAGVAPERIWAIADAAIDRAPGVQGGAATRFPDDLVLGALRLRRHQHAPEILHATWRGSPAKAAIGPALPEAALTGVNVAAGTLPLPSLGWQVQLVAASGMAVMRFVDHQATAPASLQVLVVGAAVGYPLGWHMPGPPGFGVHLTDGEPPVIPDAVEALGCVLAGRWDVLPRGLAPHVVAELVDHLLIEDRLGDAARLCESAPDDPLVRGMRGTVHALAGDLERAIASYEGANAFAPLAEVLITRGELDRALALAVTSLADMPEDALALDATVRALWHLGKLDEARAILDETPVRTRRRDALYELLARAPGPAKLVFPTLADRAHRLADRSGSQVLRDRAHILDAG